MIALHFSGYFQCRLATDPDPTDEPRGVSGTHWAVADEPDLDRIIRFHRPRAERSHGPTVGVFVRTVVLDGVERETHPLCNAQVNLLNEPRFEGRNGIIAASGSEPIVPFNIEVASDSVVLRRDSGVTDPPYQPLQALNGPYPGAGFVAAATRIWDVDTMLKDRRKKLEADRDALRRAASSDANATACSAIDSRLRLMKERGTFSSRVHGFRLTYAFPLTGAGSVRDRRKQLDRAVDTEKPWLTEFWLGGWDADAMCGFVDGWLLVPQRESPSASRDTVRLEAPGAVHPLEYADRARPRRTGVRRLNR